MAIMMWNKYDGETLALSLERFRHTYPEYMDAKITYAGRLDPMAEGLLILLTDEDVHRKEEYMGMDKVYEVSFFLGVSTDSYDILGKIISSSEDEVSEQEVKDQIDALVHITEQAYPPFSSKTVAGKPLFQWMREGKIDEIEIPKRGINIQKVEYLGREEQDDLESSILKRINMVYGDFRQDEIGEGWKNYFDTHAQSGSVYHMRIHASSGSYMRSLVHHIGQSLGIGACTLTIKRIRVGEYSLKDTKNTC